MAVPACDASPPRQSPIATCHEVAPLLIETPSGAPTHDEAFQIRDDETENTDAGNTSTDDSDEGSRACDQGCTNPLARCAEPRRKTSEPVVDVPGVTDQFIFCFGEVLQQFTEQMDDSKEDGEHALVTLFDSVRAPAIGIGDYLQRIHKYFGATPQCFVIALVYIDRVLAGNREFKITSLNVHRLAITSVLLAVKFFDDVFYTNSYYAKVGGVRTRELNSLETLFLRLVKWRLCVSPEEYSQRLRDVTFATRSLEALTFHT
jgi:hypothetical protein